MRNGWAFCFALVAGGCRMGPLDAGSPPGAATDASGDVTGGRADASRPADAGTPSPLDGGLTDGATSSTTSACVPSSSPDPRLLWPPSGSAVTSAQPQLRWTGGTSPYRVQMCADRACNDVLVDLTSIGTELALPQAMTPGYRFWRVQSIGSPSPSWTPPWEMRVRRRFPGYAPVANTSVVGFSDYNGDGYPDVAAVGTAPMIYLGGPDGISARRVWQTGPNSVSGTSFMEPQVDVNGDGFTDLGSREAVSIPGQGWPDFDARIQFGASNGFDWRDALVTVVTSYYPLAIDEPLGLGDVDGDGFGDLIMQMRYGASVIRGCSPAPPSAVWAGLGCGNCQSQQVATGDFDGDRRTDFIFADGTGINLYMGNPTMPTPIGIQGMSGLWAIDFNYDGYSDLVIHDETADALRAHEGGANGLASTLSAAAQPPAFVVVGDFDGDGYWDTIGPDCFGSCPTVTSVAYGGPGGWGAPATRTTPMDRSIAGSYPTAMVVDLNADGYDDLLAVGTDHTTLLWYAGSPNGLGTTPAAVVTPQ